MASVFDPVASAMPANALVVVDERTSQDAVGESASGARGSRGRRGSTTRVGALWSMFQVYVLLLIVVIAYNALANALRPVRLDLSPEGMMLAGGVDPSVVARYNASNYASARYEMQRRQAQSTYWTHMTRLTIRGTANSIVAVGVGSVKVGAALGRASVGLVATALESAGLGVVVDFSRAMGDGATSTVQNVAWLMTFAVAPVVDYALEPLYDFVYDGLEPLYQTFVAGTMDFFEDMTFALEQNLASVLNARVMNIIRWPLHIVLNPFKWPIGVYEAIIHPTYKFCAYPEYFDDVPEPQLPIVRSTFGDKCRSNVWGEWTECSMKCGPGFKVRANHCGKKQFSRCAGTDAIGCDGKCGSGLRTDCNGICGGKTLVDKCGVCGGMNAALGCDGKCFSGMREDTLGSCCHASTISAGGTCGSDAAVPQHLKKAASQSGKDLASQKSFFKRMTATLKSVALFFLRILSIVARVVGYVLNAVFSLVIGVLSTIFSTAMLKVIGSFTAGYMVVGVVDKKAQQNLGKFFRDAVPFLDEKETETTKNYVVAAMEKNGAPAKPKDQVESFVRRVLDDIKRAKDVPGSIMNYILWLYAKTYESIIWLSPLILDFLRDAASVHLHKAKREAAHAKAEAQRAKREKDMLLERVEAETLAVEERRKLLTETRQAMEKARAVEMESRKRQKEAEREAKRVQEEAAAELQRAKEMAEIEARKASELQRREAESLQLQERLLEEKARADRARIEEEERIARDAREKEEIRTQALRAEEARIKSRVAVQEGKVHEAVAAASQILRRVEADETSSKSLRRDVVEFEKANIANAKAAKNQIAAERAKEYCSFVTAQFGMMDAFIVAQQIVDREQDALDMVKLGDEHADIKARLMHIRPVPPSLKQTFAFLRKYDARRRSVIALVNAAFYHPEERVQVKALEALARLAAKPSIAARILATTSTIKEALRASESKKTGGARAILGMELVHAMVANREFAQMGVPFDAESAAILARALASVLKTAPAAKNTPDDIRFLVAGIDAIWRIVRYSNYDTALQTALAEEGALRYLLTLRPIANTSTELTRVLCGLAMALALENSTTQAMMTEPGVKFPRRVIKLLAQQDDIDYHGEFVRLNDFLTANAGK